MKNKLATIESIVAEFISTKPFTLGTNEIAGLETEILWEIHSKPENQSQFYLYWNLRFLEKSITSVLRKCSTSASFSGKRLLLTLVNIYEAIFQGYKSVPDDMELMILALRRHFRKFRNFAVQFPVFLKRTEIPETLATMALLPVAYFENKGLADKFEYSRFIYLQHYTDILGQLMLDNQKGNPSMRYFLSKLIELNFNHPPLRQYICDLIAQELKKYLDRETLFLKGLKKDLRQLNCGGHFVFNRKYKSLSESLFEWISVESKAFKTAQPLGVRERDRLKLKLPVSQIACLSKLYQRQDVFFDKNSNRLIDHCINAYSSKETEQMSEGSFRNHFNKISPAAAKAVCVLLTNMLTDLNNNIL